MIITFPARTNALQKKNGNEQTYGHEKKPLYLLRNSSRHDSLEISKEARARFEENKTIDMGKERLKKEAAEYRRMLEGEIRFKEADLRKVYRLDRILEAKEKIESGFYDHLSNDDLSSIFKKPVI